MDERERVIAICRDLNLPNRQYVLNGSGSMIMHGITAEERGKLMGDLDIFCATRLWFNLLSGIHQTLDDVSWSLFTTDPMDQKRRADPPYLISQMYGLEVDVFFDWRKRGVGDFDVNFYLCNQVYIEEVPCAPLQFILDWKRTTGRAKDVFDIQVLEERLENAH